MITARKPLSAHMMLLPDDSVGAVNISTNNKKDILTLSSQQNVIIHNLDLDILFTRTPEVVIGGYGSVKEWFLVVTKKT